VARQQTFTRGALLIALAATGATMSVPAVAERISAVADGPPSLGAVPISVLQGEAERAMYRIIDSGDLDGDGARDLAVAWSVRPTSGSEEAHYGIVFGRPRWPVHAARTALTNTIEVIVPQRRGLLAPSQADFTFGGLEDVDGDGRDDILIARSDDYAGNVAITVAVYHGHAQPWADLDVAATAPDFTLRQPSIGRDPAAARTIPRPNRFQSGDVNGDGLPDVMAFSCELKSPRYGRGDEGALLVWLGVIGGPAHIDMTADDPDHILYGDPGELLGCLGLYGTTDFDGDGRFDLLITGWDAPRQEHVVHFLPGRPDWPAVGHVADLAAATFFLDEDENRGDQSVYSPRFIPDVDGDGLPELKVRSAGAVYAASHLWYSRGAALSGATSVRAADLNLVDTWMDSEGLGLSGTLDARQRRDVNADGRSDLVYMLLRPNDRGPWRWRFHLDAANAPNATLRPRTDPTVGDASFERPEPAAGEARPVMWLGDFTGDGVDDMWISESTARGTDRTLDAGLNTLYGGPLTGQAAPTAAASPTTPVAPPTTTPGSPPSATATTVPPTLVASPTASPTAAPIPDGMYFPLVMFEWRR